MVHIPIRHPLSVAESWARRGKSIDNLLGRYESMFAYLAKDEKPTLHKMEDLPRLAGTDDRDRKDGNLANVEEYKAKLTSNVIKPNLEFFSQFYDMK